jgi:hypothetical protein
MAVTVQEFINSTLRLIRVLDSGESPTATESNDALTALNALIGSWSAAGVPIYQETKDSIPLTGAFSYVIPGVRPVRITAAQCFYSFISFPVAIVTSQQWSQPKERTISSHFAKELYYDGGFPTPTISLHPAPGAGTTLELFSLKPLVQFASLGDIINLPPGYEQALRYGLAGVLAPEYGSALPAEYQQQAAQATSAIAAMNTATLGQGAAPSAVPAAS